MISRRPTRHRDGHTVSIDPPLRLLPVVTGRRGEVECVLQQVQAGDIVFPRSANDLWFVRVPEPLAVLLLSNPPRFQPRLRSPLAADDEMSLVLKVKFSFTRLKSSEKELSSLWTPKRNRFPLIRQLAKLNINLAPHYSTSIRFSRRVGQSSNPSPSPVSRVVDQRAGKRWTGVFFTRAAHTAGRWGRVLPGYWFFASSRF